MPMHPREHYEALIKENTKDIACMIAAVEKRIEKDDYGNDTRRLFCLIRSFAEAGMVAFDFLRDYDKQKETEGK